MGAGDLCAPGCLWLRAQSMNLANLGCSGPVPNYIDLMWQLTCGDQPSFLNSTGSTLHETLGNEGGVYITGIQYNMRHHLLEILWLTQPQRFFPPLATLTHIIVCFLASLSLFSPSSLTVLSHCIPSKLFLRIQNSFHSYAQRMHFSLAPSQRAAPLSPLSLRISTLVSGVQIKGGCYLTGATLKLLL